MKWIAPLFVFLLVSACAKNDGAQTSPPSEVTSSGCRMDNPVDIGTATLIKGQNNLLVLGQLAFDKNPSALPPEAMTEMELHLFEQFFSVFGEKVHASGMPGFRLTNIKVGYTLGNSPIEPTGGAYHQNPEAKDGVQRYSVSRGNEADPEWKMEAVLKGNRLVALEISHPVLSADGRRTLEANCLKRAVVLQPFH